MQIIDVSNAANPVRRGGYDTPGTALHVNVAGSLVYVADGDSGLQIIDVSDPANPVRRGGYDAAGRSYDITAAGSLAYVAEYGSGLQLSLIHISETTRPY